MRGSRTSPIRTIRSSSGRFFRITAATNGISLGEKLWSFGSTPRPARCTSIPTAGFPTRTVATSSPALTPAPITIPCFGTRATGKPRSRLSFALLFCHALACGRAVRAPRVHAPYWASRLGSRHSPTASKSGRFRGPQTGKSAPRWSFALLHWRLSDCGERSPLSGRPNGLRASGSPTGPPNGKKRQSLAALHTGTPQPLSSSTSPALRVSPRPPRFPLHPALRISLALQSPEP